MQLLPQASNLRLSHRALVGRDMLSKRSMPREVAGQRLRALDGCTPYYAVEEYIEDLAALCVAFPTEVAKKPSKKVGHIYKALWRATSPARLSYIINNQRRLLLLPEEQREQMSSGTTSVEALNVEINNRFRFYGSFYQSTLLLTIKAFGGLKLLTHNSAEYCPTLSQTSQRTAAVHAMSVFRLSDEEWASVRVAGSPLVTRRVEHKNRIRAARSAVGEVATASTRGLCLPGVRKRPASFTKRHTFNKKRRQEAS